MIVPSTPTSSDKTKELKELSDKIAVLKSICERAENDTKLQVACAEDARKAVVDLQGHVDNLKKLIPEASKEVTDFITHCNTLIKEAVELTESVFKIREDVLRETQGALETLEQTKKNAREIQEEILRETIVLDRQRGDLNIYHKRLQAHFEKYMPGQKLVI